MTCKKDKVVSDSAPPKSATAEKPITDKVVLAAVKKMASNHPDLVERLRNV